MTHEIIKNLIVFLFLCFILSSISILNYKFYNRYLLRSFLGNYKINLNNLLKSIFYEAHIKRSNNVLLNIFIMTILLIVAIGTFPLTSNIWIQGSLFKSQIFNFQNDFIIITAIILFVTSLEIINTINTFKYSEINQMITRLMFISALLINKISMLLFYRTADITSIVQYQEGGTTDLFGNLIAVKNPFLLLSTFFILLIFISSNENRSGSLEKSTTKSLLINNLKHFLASQYVVYFFLGGYSFFLIPEDLLEGVPLIFNLTQLLSLYIKLVLVFTAFGYFIKKIKNYGSRSFRYFYMNFILKLSFIGLCVEIGREIFYGII